MLLSNRNTCSSENRTEAEKLLFFTRYKLSFASAIVDLKPESVGWLSYCVSACTCYPTIICTCCYSIGVNCWTQFSCRTCVLVVWKQHLMKSPDKATKRFRKECYIEKIFHISVVQTFAVFADDPATTKVEKAEFFCNSPVGTTLCSALSQNKNHENFFWSL